MIRKFGDKLIELPDDYDTNKNKYVLPIQKMENTIKDALKVIEEERSGEQHGLFCRWPDLNKAMLKYWRFNNVSGIGGLSGSGKSLILNMLLDDFTDNIDTKADEKLGIQFKKALNSDYAGEIICLHAGYEMDPADEVLRTTAGRMKSSYSYLLSSQWEEANKAYNKINEKQLDEIKRNLDGLKHKPIYYVKRIGTGEQLYCTAYEIMNKFPGKKIVVSMDHTLLSKYKDDDKNEVGMIANLAQDLIRIRKDFEAMVIPLMQLNGAIETSERRNNPVLHYPIRTDLHGSNQMSMALDNITIFHRPSLINLGIYGDKDSMQKQINDTKHLVHGAVIKSRKGKVGNTWFKEDFAHTQLLAAKRDDFITDDIAI